MLRMRTLFAIALLVPFLATSLPAQAAKMDVRAARAECFREANAAANSGVTIGHVVRCYCRTAGLWDGRLS
jgi:hypothetical protein